MAQGGGIIGRRVQGDAPEEDGIMLVLRIPYPETVFDPSSVSPDAWYDPSDLSTLWKDTGGTDPVTAAGDAVARIDDKSGNGNHLTQATAANCPLYQVDGNGNPYLLFDGADDVVNATITGFTTLPFDVIVAIRMVAWSNDGRVMRNGLTALRMRPTIPSLCVSTGTTDVVTNDTLPVGTNGVVTARHVANASKLAINDGAYVTGDAGATAPTAAFSLGAGSSTGAAPSNIRFYGGILKSGTLSDPEIASIRRHLGGKAGVIL